MLHFFAETREAKLRSGIPAWCFKHSQTVCVCVGYFFLINKESTPFEACFEQNTHRYLLYHTTRSVIYVRQRTCKMLTEGSMSGKWYYRRGRGALLGRSPTTDISPIYLSWLCRTRLRCHFITHVTILEFYREADLHTAWGEAAGETVLWFPKCSHGDIPVPKRLQSNWAQTDSLFPSF